MFKHCKSTKYVSKKKKDRKCLPNQCLTEIWNIYILYNTVEIFGGDKWIKFPEDTLIILFHQSV